jgi:hypothetical protein
LLRAVHACFPGIRHILSDAHPGTADTARPMQY